MQITVKEELTPYGRFWGVTTESTVLLFGSPDVVSPAGYIVDDKLRRMAQIAYLECSKCGNRYSSEEPRTVCPADAGSLYVRYDMDSIRSKFTKDVLHERPMSIWRYREVLPTVDPITLGEGFTPLLPLSGNPNVLIKDESRNPTGSFKARGVSVGVSMARQYGLRRLAVPSAGNAGSALAAYCAAASIEAFIFMPKDVSIANQIECRFYGAKVTLVDGPLSECVDIINQEKEREGWFDISSLKEPFRLEGKKTMGYELAEQLDWSLPDAIFFPTGGGVAVIGMWKAFEEMEELGWIGTKRPKMISVQSEGCAPIVKAWDAGKTNVDAWENPKTIALGLKVGKPYADSLILEILKKSGGAAVSVTDEQIIAAVRELAGRYGILPSPEGAATLAAYEKCLEQQKITNGERVVLFNTGSALKYMDILAKY